MAVKVGFRMEERLSGDKMKRNPDSNDYNASHPGWGCVMVCVLLIPVAILLAAFRIIWCVIDRITSVTEES